MILVASLIGFSATSAQDRLRPFAADPLADVLGLGDAAKRRVDAIHGILDLDQWISHAKLADSCLTTYAGDPKDYLSVARFLILGMNRENPALANSLSGTWVADVPGRFTFDEGAHGDAIAILSLIHARIGNVGVRGPAGENWSLLNSLQLSVRAAQRYQFVPDAHWPTVTENGFGVPGFWPQSPGADPRYPTRNKLVFPRIENLRTLNDGTTSRMTRGLLVWLRTFTPETVGADWARVRLAILLAGEGCAYVQDRYDGGLPEQIGFAGDGEWARGHEPPVISSRAVAYATEIYQDCFAITGDAYWSDRVDLSIAWFDRVSWGKDPAGNEVIFEFYDASTLRPVWAKNYVIQHRPSESASPRVEPHAGRVRVYWSIYREAMIEVFQ
jgi:hypothetical protein